MDRRDFGISLALLVAVGLVYAQVGGFDFVGYDDPDYVSRNARVQAGLSLESVAWAFTTFHFSNWHPLTWLSLLFDCTLFGVDPGALHLVNLALHALNSLLVFALLRIATGAVWRPALVAALFALHPLHVESVAWIAERKGLLSTAFGLLSLLAYAAWAKRGGRGLYVASLAFLALGLLAKPMLVTWPFVLLLLDYWPLERLRFARSLREWWLALRPRVVEKLPFFGVVIAFAFATLAAQGEGGAVVAEVSLPARVTNALSAYLLYLQKTLWPVGLAPFYPHVGERALNLGALAALALLVLVTALVLGPLRGRRYLTFGWLFYLGTLVPVIGLVQVGLQAAADRYTYVPLLGVFVALAWGLADFVARAPALRPLAAAIAVGWLALLGALSHAQTARWRDSITLFSHMVAVTPSNPVSETLYAGALVERGQVSEAIAHYRAALEQAPAFGTSLLGLGSALLSQRRVAEADELFGTAVEKYPDWDLAWMSLGQGRLAAGDAEGALEAFRNAARLGPELPPAQHGMGLALMQLGRPLEAGPHFEEALRLFPGWPDPRDALERARRAGYGAPSGAER